MVLSERCHPPRTTRTPVQCWRRMLPTLCQRTCSQQCSRRTLRPWRPPPWPQPRTATRPSARPSRNTNTCGTPPSSKSQESTSRERWISQLSSTKDFYFREEICSLFCSEGHFGTYKVEHELGDELVPLVTFEFCASVYSIYVLFTEKKVATSVCVTRFF